MLVRRATAFDFSDICRLIAAWHDETPMNYPAWEEAASIHWIADTIADGAVFVLIDEESSKIIGSIGLSGQKYPWNKSVWVLECEWFHVDIDKRGGGGGAVSLIEAAKGFSDKHSSPLVLSIMQGLDAELKDRFISTCGFDYAGGNFVYGL